MKKFNLNNRIKNMKFNFVNNLKYFIIAPLVIIAVGLVLLFTVGFNKGIDFTGGTIVNIVLGDELNETAYYNESIQKVNEVLGNNGLKASIYQLSEMDAGLALSVRYQDKNGYDVDEMDALNSTVKEELLVSFGFDPDDPTQESNVQDGQRISATASSELMTNAFLAMLIAIVAMLAYIAIRFEITSGMAAILALFHDILVMCSLVLIFRVELNSSFIAAIITIVGYSINNTIIIFDRIREYEKQEKYDTLSNSAIADKSIKDTLTRSIYTTVTTLLTIAMVAIIGVSSIRQFALPIIFGLFAGAYSSIFIAPGLWSIAYIKRKRKVKKEDTTEKTELVAE